MFFTPQLHTIHVPEHREFHYWHPTSEPIAVLSQWVSAIYRDWQVSRFVQVDYYLLSGTRKVRVYTFEMQCGTQQMTMPVLASPPIETMLQYNNFQVDYGQDFVSNTNKTAEYATAILA